MKSGGARVFEPLLEAELPVFETEGQPEEEGPADLPEPEWRAEMLQEAPVENWVPPEALEWESAARLPRRRVSTSEIITIVVLILLLLTNIWTALSIVRLERTVQSLETQTNDTYTLVTTFQEMVLDVLVRMDMMNQPPGQ
jgi:hypothetical protein